MNRKLIAAAIAVGLVGAGAAGGFFWVKSSYESQVRSGIEQLVAAVPEPCKASVGTIDVDYSKKTVVLGNFAATCTVQGEPLNVSIKRVIATDIDPKAFKAGTGNITLVKSLELENLALVGGAPEAKLEAMLETYRLEDISGDMQVILPALTKAVPGLAVAYSKGDQIAEDAEVRKQVMEAFAHVLRAYETVKVGKISMRNYTYSLPVEGMAIAVSMKNSETTRFNILNMGPAKSTGISASLNGVPFLELDSVSVDGVKLPSFVPLLEYLAANDEPSGMAVWGLLKGKDFALQNIRMGKLSVSNPLEPGKPLASLGEATFSYEAAAAHTYKSAYKDLAIAKDVYAQADVLPQEILDLLPATLHLDSTTDIAVTLKENGIADVACNTLSLKEASLGSVALGFAVQDINSLSVMMGSPGAAALKNASLTLVDKGFSEIGMTIAAQNAEQDENPELRTAKGQRANMTALLMAQSQALPNDVLKNLVNSLAGFLEKPGQSLSLSITPETATNMMQLQQFAFTAPEKLGLKAEVAPAQ